MNAKVLLSALALIAVVAAPAMAKTERAKVEHSNQATHTNVGQVAPAVVEPGMAQTPPSLANRAYVDAVRADRDPQLNRGY